MKKWELISISVAIFLAIIFRFYLGYFLHDIKFTEQLLINKNILLVLDLINLVLLYLLGKAILDVKRGVIAALLYGISPWSVYLYVASSAYIFFLFLILLDWLIISKTPLNYQKKKILTVLSTFIIILGITFIGVSKGDQTIFDDIGILNTVNQFRGELISSGMAGIGRMIENRYTYFTEFFIFNILKNFTPSTYFTPDAKLLHFSFTPPILLGLHIPFLWTFYKLIKHGTRNYNYFLIIILLIAPSVLDKNSPDLNKLIIFSPVLFLIISYGIMDIYENLKSKYILILFVCFLFLTIFQAIVVIEDISSRELIRYQKIEQK